MKKNEEYCSCTDECLGYLTMNCKEIETLEEGFDRIFDSIDYIEFDYASFEQGVKWNQERSYNKQDMIDFAYKYTDERKDQGARALTPELLIKQFKNK